MKKNLATIVICDDDTVIRRAYKKALEKIDGVRVVEIEHPEYLSDTLRENSDAAVVIMDLEFPEKPSSSKLKNIGQDYLGFIRQEYPRIKIVVVTHLGPEVYPIIIETSRMNLHDEWLDVRKENKLDELRARVESLLFPFSEVSRTGYWILHLSDLHFGDTRWLEYLGNAEEGALLEALSMDLIDKFPKECAEFRAPHLISLCGDVAHQARPEEYANASKFCHSLRAKLERKQLDHNGHSDSYFGSRPELVAIPGNHDVNWDFSLARTICKSEDGWNLGPLGDRSLVPGDLRYLEKYMWMPFGEFLVDAGARPPDHSAFWNPNKLFKGCVWNLPRAGLKIYGLNSSAETVDHFGEEPAVRAKVLYELSSFDDKIFPMVKGLPAVVLLHHPIGSIAGANVRTNDCEIMAFRSQLRRQLGAQVVLSGHIHRDVCELVTVDGISLLAISAGSSGQGENLHYNLLRLVPHRAGSEFSATVTVFSRVYFNGSFGPNPSCSQFTFGWKKDSGWIRKG